MTNALYDALFAPHAENETLFLDLDDKTSLCCDQFVNDAARKIVICDAKDEIRITTFAGSVGAQVLTLGAAGGSLSRSSDAFPARFETVPKRPVGVQVDTEAGRMQVATQLIGFKHPHQYPMLDALPRNTMGKMQMNVLRDTYGA